ncbi:phage holin family protein [Hydrocarboniphaga sp.]|uniref:phage holin family protein n=1 Tax=Hydrocarboniphaga sp. TaxID=2033016 RepID=UPI003D0BA895
MPQAQVPHDQAQVSGKLQGLAQAFLQYVRARVDLLQHEWRQEQARVLAKLARAGIFAIGALITLQLICAFVLIAFWDTPYRLWSAGVLVLLFSGVTWFAWRGMQGKDDRDEKAFNSTIAEFDKDREIFERLAELREEAKHTDAHGAASAAKPIPQPQRHSDTGSLHAPKAVPPVARSNGAAPPRPSN